jgi:deazaflavin-dependent oxidoreductase (nitroreductase family)
MARFNRVVTNRVAIHVAGWMPGMGIVTHVGRHSRRAYRTPVLVFRTKDGYRFALTYGRDAEWVKNSLAHGAVRLTTRGREHELSHPELVTDPHRQHISQPYRWFLGPLRVSEFIDFEAASPPLRR